MQQTENSSDSGQFTIGSLFFWTAFIAVALMIFLYPSPEAFLFVPIVLIGLLLGTSRISFSTAIKCSMGWLLIAVINMPPAMYDVYRSPPARITCLNNLRQLNLALLHYESTYGHFPPAYTVDEHGNRLHSWRTLILPFIEENARYTKIDLTLPWNHPDNLQYALPIPEGLRCKEVPEEIDKAFTTYQAIVGNGCLFEHGGKERQLRDVAVSDGSYRTVHLFELANHPIHWMSPYDIDYEQFIANLKKNQQELLGAHSGGCNVARVDGSVFFLSSTIDPNKLKSALLIADGGPDGDF